MQRSLRYTMLIVGSFLLAVFCALAVFLNSATNADMYYEIQKQQNVNAGIDDGTMRELDGMLALYLKGDANALDATDMFNADEKAHMADVLAIFDTLRLVKNGAFALSVLLLVYVYYNRQKYSRKELRLGLILGVMLFFTPFIAIGAWAAADFDAAFTAMHELLFANELWLMDPRTDLMIRMLPESFFMSIGLKLALRSCAAAVGVPALIFLGTFRFSRLEKLGSRPAKDE